MVILNKKVARSSSTHPKGPRSSPFISKQALKIQPILKINDVHRIHKILVWELLFKLILKGIIAYEHKTLTTSNVVVQSSQMT
jgi:hypothetical protein